MNRGVEEVFFSKVSGDFFLEIFEKSIDKHKIDAILNAPSFFKRSFTGLFDSGRKRAGGFHGRIRHDHPDTRKSNENGRELLCAHAHGRERCKDIVRLVRGVFFEKC